MKVDAKKKKELENKKFATNEAQQLQESILKIGKLLY